MANFVLPYLYRLEPTEQLGSVEEKQKKSKFHSVFCGESTEFSTSTVHLLQDHMT